MFLLLTEHLSLCLDVFSRPVWAPAYTPSVYVVMCCLAHQPHITQQEGGPHQAAPSELLFCPRFSSR